MEDEVEDAIYNKLLANSDITDITSEVYPDVAPSSASDPYIILSLNAGGDKNDNPAQQANDLRYLVKAVSTNPTTANTLASAIRSTFHEVSLTLTTWTNYRTQVISPVRYAETIDRVQYWHRGYLIRIQNNS